MIVFFSNTVIIFSKWLVFSPSSGPVHLPIAWTLTPAAVPLSYWVQAIINECVLCLCAFKMHLLAYDWCLHTFFSRQGGRPCKPVWFALDSPTTMFKGCILWPNVYCYISPRYSDQKFESSIQLVGVVFGSLLCTTEASNVHANHGHLCLVRNNLSPTQCVSNTKAQLQSWGWGLESTHSCP